MSRIAAGAALVLALGCGQTGGNTEAGETGESTAQSTGETTSATTSGTSSSGALTDGGGTAGQTEGGTSSSGTTAGTTSSGTTTGTTTGETTSTSGPGTSSTGGDLCAGFEEPGCIHNGCPNGQKCDTNVDCVPSSCSCDPETGQVSCTADCGGGTCVEPGNCEPVPCDLFCEFGFKTDEMGCEICACNDPPPPPPECGCASDADCVKASPGCCSCAMGGTEVAVAKACIDQLEPCPLPPDEVVCPAVYKCTDAQAVCVDSVCVLQ